MDPKELQGMQKVTVAWQEAREGVRRLVQITGVMKKKVEEGQIEELLSLLDDRHQICKRLDLLRKEAGITSWTAVPVQGPQELKVCSREITEAFKQLIKDDQIIKKIMNNQKITVQEDLKEVRLSRKAQKMYRGSGAAGIFIDSKS